MSVLKNRKRKRNKKGGVKRLKNSRVVNVSLPKGVLKELGPVIDITYQWKDSNYYLHTFDKNSQPLLAYDERGRLFVIEGNYTVTDEKGIIDL